MARRRGRGGCLGGLLLLAVLLLGAAYAADRLAEAAAERALVRYLETEVPLEGTPQVEVRGFPFLDQALRGEYEDVRVVLEGVRSDEVRVERLEADLTGVALPLGDLLGGEVAAVPVARSRVAALLAYDDVQDLLDRQERPVELSYGGTGELRVTGEVTFLGQTLRPSADVHVGLAGSTVRLTPQELALEGTDLGVEVPDALARRLVVEVDLPTLPFGQRLERVVPTARGLQVRASGTDVVLPEPEG